MPESNNKKIISCAGNTSQSFKIRYNILLGDSEIRVFQLAESGPVATHIYTCHYGRVKKLVILDPSTFLRYRFAFDREFIFLAAPKTEPSASLI